MHSRKIRVGAPLAPLLAKELREVVAGRALWIMLLFLCPLVGFSFVQAVDLYGAASASALQSPAAASGLSPLDGILVPTFGSFYVGETLLFPFVAIRALGMKKRREPFDCWCSCHTGLRSWRRPNSQPCSAPGFSPFCPPFRRQLFGSPQAVIFIRPRLRTLCWVICSMAS